MVGSFRGPGRLEPAHFFLIRGVPLPTWPLAPGSERGDRTRGLLVMGQALLPTELSRRGWPPGSRTQQLPLYQSGPLHRLGSGQRKRRESNPQGRSSPVFETGSVNRSDSLSMRGWWTDRTSAGLMARPPVSSRAPCHSVNHPCEEGGRLERHGVNRASLSGRARRPGRFTFHGAVGGTGEPPGTRRPVQP